MKRSRNEVARWRMLRQKNKKRTQRLESSSRRYMRIHRIRYQIRCQRQRSVLFLNNF